MSDEDYNLDIFEMTIRPNKSTKELVKMELQFFWC
jgi:hypothetical protein